MKMVWGFDMDEIICDFSTYLVEVTNDYFSLNPKLSRDDLKDYYVYKAIGRTSDEFAPVMDICSTYDNIVNREAILTGLTAMRAVKAKGCPIFIVTSRGESIRTATEDWLTKHEVPYDELIMTNHTSKLSYAKKLGIQNFVEDHPKQVAELGSAGINVLMPRYPWNDWHAYPSCVRPIDCVSHLVDMIDENGSLTTI